MMVMSEMMMSAAHCLRQILDIRKLAARRSAGEVRCKLIELGGGVGIAIGLSRLGCALQIRSDLLRHLLVLRWVRLL